MTPLRLCTLALKRVFGTVDVDVVVFFVGHHACVMFLALVRVVGHELLGVTTILYVLRLVQSQPTVLLSLTTLSVRNKKSELVLMRRARAYSSSCLRVILVYLHPFRRSSLFSSQKLPRNH